MQMQVDLTMVHSEHILVFFRKDPYCARPFEGLKIVDVGCGGGILSEPLARMGATVTGVDAVEKNIKIARLHSYGSSSSSRLAARGLCTQRKSSTQMRNPFQQGGPKFPSGAFVNPSHSCQGLCTQWKSSTQMRDTFQQGGPKFPSGAFVNPSHRANCLMSMVILISIVLENTCMAFLCVLSS
ncbi:Ubiquinone biosynthesis O-methyltransferase, mitochondrial [Vitis vinifera]|uniref:Ubiquinone biosynthesis O-methyltransferase, mitochondrial n=1 Tax=Vitis vinifera TaxID=29760 RepID=A0A438CDT1_VITVI|nr:Ubiquinone biosynthesis O-methyltransferase, mitochondrial [Vitis vinifera]